jgi:hypothetical protein
MSELSKYLVEQILLEDDNPIKKTVVVYVGRFQPFHKGHYSTYQNLVKKFGKDNVFIGTSNKIEKPKSPFGYKEKVQIMTTMFGIPSSKIHQVKNPYQPTEILKKFDEKTTAFITVVGEKDSSRLGGKYFQPYKGEPTEGYKDRGYVYVSPSQSNLSGTDVRNGLSLGSDEQKQNFFTDKAYPKYNKTIFNLITSKLNEGIEITKERIEEWLLNEASVLGSNGGKDVDDGPSFFFPNFEVFSKINVKRAAKIGYEVVNMITHGELEDYYDHPDYPNGPVQAVTFFPAGVIGAKTPNNQVDIYSSGAYSKWFKHVTRKASLVGYSLVTTKQAKDGLAHDKSQSGAEARGDKELKDEFEKSIQEVIKLPVEIGDTLLMGKFKNKKVVVKSIGEDEHGLPTINGKKVVTFRYGQKAPNIFDHYIVELAGTSIKCEKCNHQWEIEADDKEKYLCHSCGWDSQKQEYDYDAFDSWIEKNGILDEALSQTQRAARRWAFAKNRKLINIKKQRTAIRKKPYAVLYKRAYKLAYLSVRKEWSQRLFGSTPYDALSIPNKQRVSQMVQRKKRKILKLAKFKFFPHLKQKEADKFGHDSIQQNVTYVQPNVDELLMGYPDQEWLDSHDGEMQQLRNKLDSDKDYQYDIVKKNMSEGNELEKLGITDFKSLFKMMPSELQKRVYNLKNFGQRLDKHSEGNVLKHTIVVVNRSLKDDDIDIAIAAMFHDIGKDETAGIHKTKGHITHFGHEKVSASLVSKYKDWIKSVGGNAANVLYIVKNHMRYKQLSDMRPVKQDRLKSFRAYDKLDKFSKHDRGGLGESLNESNNFKLNVSINEAKQVGILYHYTGYSQAIDILKDGKLRSDIGGPLGKLDNPYYSISFTRNRNFHKHARALTHAGNNIPIRFTFDGNKMSNNFKITPYAQSGFEKTKQSFEAEEVITSKKVFDVSLSNYLISVDILVELKNPGSSRYDFDWDMYGDSFNQQIQLAKSKGLKINMVGKNGESIPRKEKETLLQKLSKLSKTVLKNINVFEEVNQTVSINEAMIKKSQNKNQWRLNTYNKLDNDNL